MALRERAADYAPLFARAKAEVGYGQCLCRLPGLSRIIRCSRAGRYHLAGWPGEGDRHRINCPFHKLATQLSGRSRYATEAIQDTDTGTTIRLDAPLTRQLTHPAPHNPGENQPRPGHTRRRVGLGLLHWLWEEAQLTAWHPLWRRRNWGICSYRLRQQAADCSVTDQALGDVLFVVPPFRPETSERTAAAFAAFRTRLSPPQQVVNRGLILGEVKDIIDTPYVLMADRLAESGRAYIKPLRYDASDELLPDFVLVDTHPHAFVEVYGIHGRETYDRRKRVKPALHQQHGARLIEWDVTAAMPELTLAIHRGP
ncbi:DUF1173 family protein [Streptomyces sp. 7N604]|uniref:DUF1173 family protein n=1 Tax=Streptomyces sp. 7N604 TaxID=3457415 RepID=UPI003FCF73D1